jgi:hypothetical protein
MRGDREHGNERMTKIKQTIDEVFATPDINGRC